jgi:hypothetical protein
MHFRATRVIIVFSEWQQDGRLQSPDSVRLGAIPVALRSHNSPSPRPTFQTTTTSAFRPSSTPLRLELLIARSFNPLALPIIHSTIHCGSTTPNIHRSPSITRLSVARSAARPPHWRAPKFRFFRPDPPTVLSDICVGIILKVAVEADLVT